MGTRFENRQSQKQKQKLESQQRLSPQQLQFVKLIQLPLAGLEQRVKQEIENNPVLEEFDPSSDLMDDVYGLDDSDMDGRSEVDAEVEAGTDSGSGTDAESAPDSDTDMGDDALDAGIEDDADRVDAPDEIDWEEYAKNTEYEGTTNGYSAQQLEEWNDIPDPYRQTLLERLEQQVQLLDLDEGEQLIADQILGSLDEDGYFRRELAAVADKIAFNYGYDVSEEDVERIRKKIQQLEPAGIASTDLRDCLLSQLIQNDRPSDVQTLANELLTRHWTAFEKKHFDVIQKRMGLDSEEVSAVYDLIRTLDPKPGATGEPENSGTQYIEPDFEVIWNPEAVKPDMSSGAKGTGAVRTLGDQGARDEATSDEGARDMATSDEGGRDEATSDERSDGYGAEDGADTSHRENEFIIRLSRKNLPDLRISPQYKELWNTVRNDKRSGSSQNETREFIKEKMESAKWFIESIRQRQNTLRKTMTAIVDLQKDFFRYGEPIRPMIMKDVARRIEMDISTVSRVVNGKYVQTRFGVYELKYFFSEALETEEGEDVSTREVKKVLRQLIESEDKSAPLSDQKLTDELSEKGYKVARRTVAKYREQLQYPVARLRKEITG